MVEALLQCENSAEFWTVAQGFKIRCKKCWYNLFLFSHSFLLEENKLGMQKKLFFFCGLHGFN